MKLWYTNRLPFITKLEVLNCTQEFMVHESIVKNKAVHCMVSTAIIGHTYDKSYLHYMYL